MNDNIRPAFIVSLPNGFSMAANPAASTNQMNPPAAMVPGNQGFGVTTVDNVSIPFIKRGQTKFVSVKMVENKLLSKFPKISMDDMNNVGPIYSYYITESEAKLLSDISSKFSSSEYGVKSFTTRDLIVSLEDFETFYLRAKNHFNAKMKSGNVMGLQSSNGNNMVFKPNPNQQSGPVPTSFNSNPMLMPSVPNGQASVPVSIPGKSALEGNKHLPMSMPQYRPTPITIAPIPAVSIRPSNGSLMPDLRPPLTSMATSGIMGPTHSSIGGWVQINNTVVPYVVRSGVKYVPLSVIKYSAGLLTDIRISGYKVPVTEEEFTFLNKSCKTAGVNFTFSIKTKLIKLELVIRMSHSKVDVHELPYHNPFTHAQWKHEYNKKSIPTSQIGQSIAPTGLNQMPPRNPFLPNPNINNQGAPVAQIRPQIVPRPDMKHSPVNGANVRQSNTKSGITAPGAIIKSLHFEGKTISCLIRDNEKDPLALLEALVRLYFPTCSITDFQLTLEKILCVPVFDLSPEEEMEFIRFYGLKVKSLRCKSIISFESFKNNYTKLATIFANKVHRNTPVASNNADEPPKSTESSPVTTHKVLENNNNNNEVLAVPKVLENRAMSASPVELIGLKRKQDMSSHQRKNKQPKRLEDTVAKLKFMRETNGNETD